MLKSNVVVGPNLSLTAAAQGRGECFKLWILAALELLQKIEVLGQLVAAWRGRSVAVQSIDTGDSCLVGARMGHAFIAHFRCKLHFNAGSIYKRFVKMTQGSLGLFV